MDKIKIRNIIGPIGIVLVFIGGVSHYYNGIEFDRVRELCNGIGWVLIIIALLLRYKIVKRDI